MAGIQLYSYQPAVLFIAVVLQLLLLAYRTNSRVVAGTLVFLSLPVLCIIIAYDNVEIFKFLNNLQIFCKILNITHYYLEYFAQRMQRCAFFIMLNVNLYHQQKSQQINTSDVARAAVAGGGKKQQ